MLYYCHQNHYSWTLLRETVVGLYMEVTVDLLVNTAHLSSSCSRSRSSAEVSQLDLDSESEPSSVALCTASG